MKSPTPPAGLTQSPLLPSEQAAAEEAFLTCALWYQERIQGVTVTGSVTPMLLEQWADAFDAASQSAAEGDPVAASKACQELRFKMEKLVNGY